VNEKLLCDTAEARAFAFGHGGEASSPEVETHLEFIRQPTARNWYCAHNVSIVAAYLANEELAREEARVERFFINVVRCLAIQTVAVDPDRPSGHSRLERAPS
jgi:hypothetical protein